MNNVKKWEQDILRTWTTEEITATLIAHTRNKEPIPGHVSEEALRLELINRGVDPRSIHKQVI